MNQEEVLSLLHEKIEQALSTYQTMIYRIALSYTKNQADAEDLFQEVFVAYMKVLQKSKNFEPFQSRDHEKAWFIRVAINKSKNHLKSAWNTKTTGLTADYPITEKPEDNSLEVLYSLPDQFRNVLYLYYYEELTISQIASIFEQKEATIRQQMSRGRKLLKSKLKGVYRYE